MKGLFWDLYNKINLFTLIDWYHFLWSHKGEPNITIFFLGIFGLGQGESSKCFQTGECIESIYLGTEPSSDEYACLELCESTENCDWSTYFQSTGLCKLFNNCPSLDADKCPDCLSGPIGCTPLNLQCWIQVLNRI